MPEQTLSVVIPVYNEEKYLKRCIDALLKQIDFITEIVVVDNNSNDSSVSILKEYSERFDKVKFISESVPGVVHARNAGFDITKSSLIGRIDADTVVSDGWAKCVIDFFTYRDDISGATGLSYLYETPISNYRTRSLDRQVERGKIRDARPLPMLQGNNMAIRRDAWYSVRDVVSVSDQIHEDIDLTMCFIEKNLAIVQLLGMRAEISGRRGWTSPLEYARYIGASRRTYGRHGIKNPLLTALLGINILMHIVLWPFHLAYDPVREHMSVRNLLQSRSTRALPFSSDR
ncbi:glycosyltransferase [Rhodococcus erythropolis]|uniref:glycosyltransferase n=1 Tax=Rhodococcus erythropolis TaxID=1833 RepID=UPI004041F6CF